MGNTNNVIANIYSNLKKAIKNTNVKLWRLIRNSLIVALIMIIVITLLAASYERYSLDYTWMVVWPAIAMMLLIYDLIKENELVRKMFEIVCTIATIICNLCSNGYGHKI